MSLMTDLGTKVGAEFKAHRLRMDGMNITNENGVIKDLQGNILGSHITNIEHTASAGQTNFSCDYNVGFVDVHMNGVLLAKSDYTADNGTNVVLNAGASDGDIISIQGITGAFNVANTYSKNESDSLFQPVGNYEPADATIVKESELKTINGNSIVGSGDIDTANITLYNKAYMTRVFSGDMPADGSEVDTQVLLNESSDNFSILMFISIYVPNDTEPYNKMTTMVVALSKNRGSGPTYDVISLQNGSAVGTLTLGVSNQGFTFARDDVADNALKYKVQFTRMGGMYNA